MTYGRTHQQETHTMVAQMLKAGFGVEDIPRNGPAEVYHHQSRAGFGRSANWLSRVAPRQGFGPPACGKHIPFPSPLQGSSK